MRINHYSYDLPDSYDLPGREASDHVFCPICEAERKCVTFKVGAPCGQKGARSPANRLESANSLRPLTALERGSCWNINRVESYLT